MKDDWENASLDALQARCMRLENDLEELRRPWVVFNNVALPRESIVCIENTPDGAIVCSRADDRIFQAPTGESYEDSLVTFLGDKAPGGA